jgi:hypothetical protein
MTNLQSWAKICLAILLAAGLGYAGGRYAQPSQVVIQTKEVVKTVTVVQHDTVTITKQVKKPDGTTETDTTITDKDVDTTNSSMKESSSETITNLKPQWKATGQYGYNFSSAEKVYGAEVDRRILGPIFVGVWGNSDHVGGLAVSVEF